MVSVLLIPTAMIFSIFLSKIRLMEILIALPIHLLDEYAQPYDRPACRLKLYPLRNRMKNNLR
jgi:hypothetical protein